MQKRKWDTDTILGIVVEGLRGERTIAEICREHHCSETQFYKWRDRFLEGGKRGLVNGGNDADKGYKAEIERLQRIIGKQAIHIEILKKTEELMGSGSLR